MSTETIKKIIKEFAGMVKGVMEISLGEEYQVQLWYLSLSELRKIVDECRKGGIVILNSSSSGAGSIMTNTTAICRT